MAESEGKEPSEDATKPDQAEEDAAEEAEDDDEEPQLTRGQAMFRIAVMSLVLLVVVEAVARIARAVHRSRVDTAAAADYPPGTYIADFAAKARYRFINFYTVDPKLGNQGAYEFDAFGFRLDKRKLAFDQPNAFKKIWMIGGSTVQGLGALGDETIAANLNQLLEDAHSPYRVINMGQGGFTSTQELLLLMELVQTGRKPDILLQYGGATEMPFAGDLDTTGSVEWEKRGNKSSLLLDIQGDESSGTLIGLALSRMTRIDDVMISLRRRMNPGADTSFVADNWDVVMRKHLSTLGMEKAIADQLEVPAFFFFQPILAYEHEEKLRTLSPEETTNLVPRLTKGEMKRVEMLHSPAMADLLKRMGPRFFDIHDVFKGQDGKKLYADARHPNGAGNALIAKRMFEELKKVEGVVPSGG